jgi:benzylsuccinate CoA-transferase BbsF subunit
MQRPELADDPRFARAASRRLHEDALETIVAGWTATQDAETAARALQGRGVPAYAVQNSPELLRDPQLLARDHFHHVRHPEYGATTIEGSRFVLSRTPASLPGVAPTFGADNEYVLRELLGYDDERITALAASGALA